MTTFEREKPQGWAPLPLPEIHSGILPNGLRYLMIRRSEQPVVILDLRVRAGTVLDPPARTGLVDLTASLLRQGTERRSAKEISEMVDSAGGTLSSEANMDYTAVRSLYLSRDLEAGLGLLSEIVLHPAFPEEEIDEMKRQTISALQRDKDEPSNLADQNLDCLIFGEGSPYGRVETEESIGSIGRPDLQEVHESYYRPGNAILALTGDLDFEKAEKSLAALFGGWTAAEVPPAALTFREYPRKIRIRLIDRPDLSQAYLSMGHPGPSRLHPDYIPVGLMNYSLGGGQFSSRLVKVVRSHYGKTYDVNSTYSAWKDAGRFRVATFTRSAETGATLEILLHELSKMRDGGPTADELETAKSFYIGSYPLQVETPSGLADRILAAEILGLGIDYVRNYRRMVGEIPLARCVEAARSWLHPDDLTICVVGNAEAVAPQLEAFGPVERTHYLDPIRESAPER